MQQMGLGNFDRGTFLCNYFKFGPGAKKELLFKDISNFSSGDHLFNRAKSFVQFW